MHDWNVVVTLRSRFNEARRILRPMGQVESTSFFNVLVMNVDDPKRFLEAVRDRMLTRPGAMSAVARVSPIQRTFVFETPEELERKACEVLESLLPILAGRSFHVRVRRRGLKGRISTPKLELALASFVLDALAARGAPGRIRFDDPDAVVILEMVGMQAGLSIWTREDLERYPFLSPDS